MTKFAPHQALKLITRGNLTLMKGSYSTVWCVTSHAPKPRRRIFSVWMEALNVLLLFSSTKRCLLNPNSFHCDYESLDGQSGPGVLSTCSDIIRPKTTQAHLFGVDGDASRGVGACVVTYHTVEYDPFIKVNLHHVINFRKPRRRNSSVWMEALRDDLPDSTLLV